MSVLVLLLTTVSAAMSAQPPCNPCAGLSVESPLSVAEALSQLPPLQEEARLYVRWLRDATAAGSEDVGGTLAASGATPWLGLRFDTPSPVLEHLDRLNEEIEAAVETAKRQPQILHFQVFWNPIDAPGTGLDLDEYTFLFKRVSVALRGATAEARVLPQPLPADAASLRQFYELGNLAYLDGISFATGSDDERGTPLTQELVDLLAELDPGRPIVVERPVIAASPTKSLAIAARLAAQGASVVLFDVDRATPEIVAPLVVLANEFRGDISYDPHSSPTGDGLEAWAFVRGEDLSSLVIVSAPNRDQPAQIWFADPSLRNPEAFDLATGDRHSLFGLERSADRLAIRLEDTAPVAILNLERPSIEDLQGVEERVEVAGDKIIPVEEILRRLQAFEDAQARRLDHYQAVHTNHLRFEGATNETLEVAYEGDYFFQRDKGFD
ncbi:MAG: hypothetical protein K8J08_13025, partial [Thermoanaerobaculia bacterium]|nr:hypothetical protein [Thermoanaerobaculia bacterium]